jgi:hypothetical protein
MLIRTLVITGIDPVIWMHGSSPRMTVDKNKHCRKDQFHSFDLP